MSATQTEHSGPPEAQCLARSVVDALESEPTLEAVTIDRARHTISVATLGKADLPQLTERIRDTVERTRGTDSTPPCNLLAGEGDCQTCTRPLSGNARQ